MNENRTPKEVVAELEAKLVEKEKELELLSTQFDLLFNHFLDAILVVESSSGLITAANDSAVRFLKYPRDELLSSDFHLLFPQEAASERVQLFDNLRVHGHAFFEQRFLRSDGEVIVADLSAAMVIWRGHGAVLIILRDATERRAFETRLLEAEELEARLETVARLNHEINNPLQELLSIVDLDGDSRYREPVMRIASVLQVLRQQEQVFASIRLTEKSTEGPSKEPLEPCRMNAVMVADDEIPIRTLLNKGLSRGLPMLSIDVAASGIEAVEQFGKTHHEAIIMDVNMPGMNGDEAFLKIMEMCQERKWAPPAVVFCTGYNIPASIRASVERSPKHLCLLKPVEMGHIIDAIRQRVTG